MKKILLALLLLPLWANAQTVSTSASWMYVEKGIDGYALADVKFSHSFAGYPDFYELTATVQSKADSVVFDYYDTAHFARHTQYPDGGIVRDTLRTDNLSTIHTLIKAFHDGEVYSVRRTFDDADHFWAVQEKKNAMAFPPIEILTQRINPASTTRTYSITMPDTVNQGDRIFVSISATATGRVFSNSDPDWVKKDEDDISSGLDTYSIWEKTADGTEGSTTVDFSIDEFTGDGTAIVIRISGASNLSVSARSNGSSANPDPPSFSPSWGSSDNTWIALAHARDDAANFDAAPTNYTTLRQVDSGGGTNSSVEQAVAYRDNAVATEDPGTFTLSQSEGWSAFTIAVEGSSGSIVSASMGVDTSSSIASGTQLQAETDVSQLQNSGISQNGSGTVDGNVSQDNQSNITDQAKATADDSLMQAMQNAINESASADIGAGINTGASSSVDPSGGSIGNIGLSLQQQATINAVGSAISNGSIQQGAIDEINILPEANGLVSVDLQLSSDNLLAMSAQSVVDPSYSIVSVNTLSKEGQAISTESLPMALENGILTNKDVYINVDMNMGGQAGSSLQTTADYTASIEQALQSSLSVMSQATAQAAISGSVISGITITGTKVAFTVTKPDGRTLTVEFEDRTYRIERESRIYSILHEPRAYIIQNENRTLLI